METPDKPITVMLVDDHALFRSGIRSLLQRHADFSVVGEAADGTFGDVAGDVAGGGAAGAAGGGDGAGVQAASRMKAGHDSGSFMRCTRLGGDGPC